MFTGQTVAVIPQAFNVLTDNVPTGVATCGGGEATHASNVSLVSIDREPYRMPQKQGPNSTHGGRLDGSVGTAVAAANIALGVGWGDGTNVVDVAAGSTDQRGSVTITTDGANQAQATATVTLTFADGAFAGTPFGFVNLQDNTNAITERQPTDVACTTTALTWTNSVLPVTAKDYTFSWLVIA